MKKRREPRQAVNIGARLESDDGRAEIQILNISSRGFMAMCSDPPVRGSYVEIRLGSTVIVGRVAWNSTDRFGAFTRDRIAFSEPAPTGDGNKPRSATLFIHQPRRQSIEERQAASSRFARLFDFAVLAGAAAILAMFVGGLAARALDDPFETVQTAFRQNSR